MQDTEDWALAFRARDGDTDAFARLVRRYQRPVVHFCARMTGSLEDAEDVAQEVFLGLHRSLPTLEPRARLSTLLFGIARNLSLNCIRNGKRRGRDRMVSLDAAVVEHAGGVTPDRHAQASELGSLLEAALLRLPEDQREVLLLREFEHMDYGAIAETVGCPVGTVRSRLARARESLRRELEAWDQNGC